MACPRCCTTGSRAAPPPTWRSRKRCCRGVRRRSRSRQEAESAATHLTQENLMIERRPALGKGLSALIPDAPEAPRASAGPLQIDIDLLAPNQQQPRVQMDDAKLEELAQS